VDGKQHRVSAQFLVSPEIVVNEPSQLAKYRFEKIGDLGTVRVGSVDQPVLAKKGDDLRIDWGYLFLAVPEIKTSLTANSTQVKNALAEARKANPTGHVSVSGSERISAGVALVDPAAWRANRQPLSLIRPFPDSEVESLNAKLEQEPSAVNGEALNLVAFFSFGQVGPQSVSRWFMLAYDDLYSIQYLRKNLRPYWRRNGWEAADLLKAAAKDYESLKKRCTAFDEELMADLTRAGGEQYARLAALAYRQCFAAGKFVADANGQPLQFCKENHSNGCIGTSDVFYPMSPQFLLFGPTLAKSFLVPFMNYAASERWKFPFAPHDLGTYPKANGQVYGGGERTEENQMPVEESGNLLCLFGAIAQMEGHANFAGLYWKQLEQWAEYLKAKGFDPENQLCTDDFAGHLAHNVNLSAKAICGLGAFAKLCELRGDKAKAAEYSKLAREFAQRWVKEADDGDHFRLAFDKPGTWSQKYNLMWDRILGLNLFPAEVLRKEMDYYKKIQNQYGLPLDNRSTYTKLDWITWTATLTQKRADFEVLIDPVFRFLNETPDRSPMTDWYFTDTAKKRGFTARPVVGGVFAQLLYDKAVWAKWASRDKTKAANWAPMPQQPQVTRLLPTAQDAQLVWRYTTQQPGAEWLKPSYDDSEWQQGEAGFGITGTPSAMVRTEWTTPEIWLRREFELKDTRFNDLRLELSHTGDCEVFLNGALALRNEGSLRGYDPLGINPEALKTLRPGKNVIAVHAKAGGNRKRAYVDVGIVDLRP
jgi:hypothetical protein